MPYYRLVAVQPSFYSLSTECKSDYTFSVLINRYIFFQLKSHSYLYEDVAIEEEESEIATIPPWWAVGLYYTHFHKQLT